jgi:hypothetical protein
MNNVTVGYTNDKNMTLRYTKMIKILPYAIPKWQKYEPTLYQNGEKGTPSNPSTRVYLNV